MAVLVGEAVATWNENNKCIVTNFKTIGSGLFSRVMEIDSKF